MRESSARRRSALVVLGVVGMLFAAAVGSAGAAAGAAQQDRPEADNTVTRIHVYENGTARWTVQVRTRLDSADRLAEFEAYQTRFDANTSAILDRFRTRIRRVVAAAADATGREMRATAFAASTSIQEVPRRWGVVTFAFTWTNFATRSNGRVVVGDVFQGGFFLAANDTLVVEAPDDYVVERVAPDPGVREPAAVTWTGRQDFRDGHPQVEFVTQDDEGAPTGPSPSSSGPLAGVGPVVWLAGGALLAIAALGYGAYRRRAAGEPPVDAVALSEPTDRTDEERVVELLDAHGGRMRQAAVAEEFGWSASKTSRVVARLVEEGAVEKLQVGRENLLDLTEEE